jgi:hypothetical protein
MDITKKEKALLRQLAHEAWKTELDAELEKLFKDFGRWADKGMSAFDLSDKIHEFHNGVSRELYVRYSNPSLAAAVSRAVAIGVLSEDALGETLLEKLLPLIEFFKNMDSE